MAFVKVPQTPQSGTIKLQTTDASQAIANPAKVMLKPEGSLIVQTNFGDDHDLFRTKVTCHVLIDGQDMVCRRLKPSK